MRFLFILTGLPFLIIACVLIAYFNIPFNYFRVLLMYLGVALILDGFKRSKRMTTRKNRFSKCFSGIVTAICSFGVLTTIPILLNKRSQVPRWTSSVPIAVFLSIMVPAFYEDGLILTTITLIGAIVWWLVEISSDKEVRNRQQILV